MLDERYSAAYFRQLDPKARRKAILGLTPAQAEAILYDWEFWARPNQLPPPDSAAKCGKWLTWLIRSGRGFGKTRTGSETSHRWAKNGESGQILIAGRTASDMRDFQIEGPSGLLRTAAPWFMPRYEPSKKRITWPKLDCYGLQTFGSTSSVIGVLRSGDEPSGFRGFEGGRAWLDELFHWARARESYDNLMFGMREVGDIRMLVTSSPLPTELCRELIKSDDTVDVKGSTYDNADNLSADYIAKVRKRYEGTRTGMQELHGEVLDDVPGAQWKWAQISADRIERAAMPVLEFKAVAIDPATSCHDKSDECGITAGGRGVDGHGYLTHDESGRYSPLGWATRAVALFLRTNANVIYIEDNNGGDMCESTLRAVKADLPIRRIHAKDGKRVRAEPIAAKCEQHKIHHVGFFPELETQLCTIDLDNPDPDAHDDRLDSFVHLFAGCLPDATSLRSRFNAMA